MKTQLCTGYCSMRCLSYLLVIGLVITTCLTASVQAFPGHSPALEGIADTANPGIDISVSEPCLFQSVPEVIRSEPGVLLQQWIEVDRPVLFGPTLPAATSLHEFRDSVNQLLNTEPLVLLTDQLSQVSGGDAVNVNLVLEGEAGMIRKMNCLEGLLLSVQTERSVIQGNSMYSHPTEFVSYILTRGDTLKIYFYTVDQPGIGGLSVFDELLDRDQVDGWVVTRNIHNHNFFPGSKEVLGGVVPSAADVQYFRNAVRRYGLSGASITNGFHSIDLSPDDFEKFSTGSSESTETSQ